LNISPKDIITWVLILAVPVSMAIILTGLLNLMPFEIMVEVTREHFAAVVGLPVSAIFSAFIVVALEQSSGPVKFEGLGFKFEGSAGQVVLWVLCFLALVIGIRVLW